MNPLIIKLGGVLLDSEEALERLFTALVNYREAHQRPLIIVHGGGCVVDELMKQLNLPVQKKNGLRVTPAEQIDIITGALAGTANKTLLAWAKKHGISSVGLFLGDGDSVKVTQLDAELGHVGLAQPGSPTLINTLLAGGYLPVVSSIGVTDEGQLMNVNADQAATALAATLGADLILMTGGMSVDPDDLTPTAIADAGAEVVTYGMPSQPGNMLLVAYAGKTCIVGVPGAAVKLPTTTLDVVLPQIFTGVKFKKEDFVRLGDGGFCQSCDGCHWPNCTFGRY